MSFVFSRVQRHKTGGAWEAGHPQENTVTSDGDTVRLKEKSGTRKPGCRI